MTITYVMVTKTFLVKTDDLDEAYELTKINNDKVATFAVGQLRPYDPDAPTGQPQRQNIPATVVGPVPPK